MGKKIVTKAPVVWGAKTLEDIGKPNYSGVAAAISATGGLGKKQIKK